MIKSHDSRHNVRVSVLCGGALMRVSAAPSWRALLSKDERAVENARARFLRMNVGDRLAEH